MENSRQHSELPNNMLKIEDLQAKDLIVYIAIKRYVDAKTKRAVVSFETIAKKLGCSEKTVRTAVDKLIKAGYITKVKVGKCNGYLFAQCDHFEMFFVDFIDNPDMTYQQKAFYAAQQQHMIKENNLCKTTYNSFEISKELHIAPKTVKKYEQEFKDHGWMVESQTNAIDEETGCLKTEKIYFPEKFGQAMLFIAMKHEIDIQDIRKQNLDTAEEVSQLKEVIASMKKDMEALKQAAIDKQSTHEPLTL